LSLSFFLILAVGVPTFYGCSSVSTAFLDENHSFLATSTEEREARRDLSVAENLLKTVGPGEAIPRLLGVVSRYPNTQPARDARFYLATAYAQTKNDHDAIAMYEEYLRLAPNGAYAEQAREELDQVRARYDAEYMSAEELDEKIETLALQLQENPSDLEGQWLLADLLWRRGNYEDAGRLYLHLFERDPAYGNRTLFKKRVEISSDGAMTLLTPLEMRRRETNASPLQILETSSFRSERQPGRRKEEYYIVTGQLQNRGESVLYGVEVVTTLFGFVNMVYDTNTFYIGRLDPGERRAFSVRFSNFDSIENIARYECTATFAR